MSGSVRISTSMLIAAAELLAAQRARRVDLAARLARGCLQASGTPGARLIRLIDSAAGRLVLRTAEALILPGITAHYAWRKRQIRRWVEAELAAGTRQLLVIGAGFDALALHMTRDHPSLRAYEIDRPESMAAKQRALHGLGISHPRLIMHGVDLSQHGAGGVLRNLDGFDREAGATILAEGVLMYLEPVSVRALWLGLRGAFDGQVTVIATAMDCGGDGSPRFHRQRRWLHDWLARRGEPFRWGVARNQLSATMRESGIAIDAVADPNDAANSDPCPGEWLFRGKLIGT